jgi:MFS transporter, OFA family, oxalate/formate antiporter
MSDARSGVPALVGSGIAIFWPGAFIFGFPGVMASYWQESFLVGRGAIGNILFFVLAAVGIFMFVVGRWQERFGTRAMISIGAIICGLDVVLVAYASSLWMVYLFAFLMGMSSAFIYIPALTTVQRWFPLRRGLVSGIVNFMFGFSAAIMCPVFGYMLEKLGYFSMNVCIAIIAIVAGLIAAQFTDMPKQEIPIGGQVPGSSKPTAPVLGPSLTVREALVTSSFWFLWLTWALQGAAGIAMVTLSTGYGVSRGFSLEAAVIILTAFNVTNGISRLVTGSVSDIAGRNPTMSFAFLAAGLAYLLLPHVSGLWAIVVLAAVIGFAFGALFAVSGPLAMDCFGVTHFGAIFGLVFTAYGFVAGVLGPSVSGYVLDATQGNFHVVFGYLGMFCLISAIFIRFVLPPKAMSTHRASSVRGA